jgi:arylsulfatase A-like enzyme
MAIAPADQTLSSHASLFTGLHVRSHGAFPTGPATRTLPGRFDTLAERMAARGYATLGVVSNHGYLGHGWNLDQGFGYYDARPPVTFPGDAEPFLIRRGMRDLVVHAAGIDRRPLMYRQASAINDEVFALLDTREPAARPFFLFINYMDAHWPYVPPPPFAGRFPGRLPGGLSADAFDDLQHDVIRLRRQITDAERNHLIAGYDGALAFLDSELERLVERLKTLELYDNTLFIVTSDHGESFGDRQFLGHAMSVYQDQVLVPLLIKYPRSSEPVRVEQPVSLIDLFPTILHFAGDREAPPVQGRSLLALDAPRTILSESAPASWHPRFERTEYARFEGGLKLITSTQGKLELYDPAADPNEERDLAAARQADARALQSDFERWLSTLPAASDASPAVDPEAVERLKGLGYIR